MKNNLYEVTIQWLDNKSTETVLFSSGDITNNEDDDIFYYIEDEKEFEYFRTEGVNEFIVLDYHKLNN